MTLPSLDGALWLRPTTPPRFDAAAALSSLDHAAAALRGDERLCYAHWGLSEDPAGRLSLAREQTERWLELIGTMLDRRPEEVVECLLRRDPPASGPAGRGPDGPGTALHGQQRAGFHGVPERGWTRAGPPTLTGCRPNLRL